MSGRALRSVREAFQRGLHLHVWDCARGLHEPAFLLRTWACATCGRPLSATAIDRLK